MKSTKKSVLPKKLLAYKENIQATIKPFVEIKATMNDNLSLWQSKFGGFPYLPSGYHYPQDSKGLPMALLGQLNFAETPGLQLFPDKGILQFYISGSSTVYGKCYQDLTKQDDFKVIFFPDVIEDVNFLITDFAFLPKHESLPFNNSCSLTFTLESAPISVNDYQFDSKIIGQAANLSEDEYDLIIRKYENLFNSNGHKIGGYPFFTQGDIRGDALYSQEDYILLFQMTSDEDTKIMWGDLGVGHFFIVERDLVARDFSKVLYYWDNF